MELGGLRQKTIAFVKKFKFVIIVIVVGLILMLIPGKETVSHVESLNTDINETAEREFNIAESLAAILSQIDGAGRVEVFLTTLEGEETVFQTDDDVSENSNRSQTIIVTDSNRREEGLVKQVNPPQYRGAIVVCDGADNPSVQLSIVEAVSKVTGLGTNRISVLKMK